MGHYSCRGDPDKKRVKKIPLQSLAEFRFALPCQFSPNAVTVKNMPTIGLESEHKTYRLLTAQAVKMPRLTS